MKEAPFLDEENRQNETMSYLVMRYVLKTMGFLQEFPTTGGALSKSPSDRGTFKSLRTTSAGGKNKGTLLTSKDEACYENEVNMFNYSVIKKIEK